MRDPEFRDRAAFFPDTRTLVVADIHVGKDESSGVAFPLGERADLCDRLDELCSIFSPAEVVFAGDVLHRFGAVTERAEAILHEVTETVRAAGARPILVRGNHDTLLDSVWDGDVHDEYLTGDVLVCHGHAEPTRDAACYVVGHDHPAITIEGQKRPCYLYGEDVYRGGCLVVLPAFNRLAAGVSVNRLDAEEFQSPLVSDLDALRPLVYDDDAQETLRFPPLGEFRTML